MRFARRSSPMHILSSVLSLILLLFTFSARANATELRSERIKVIIDTDPGIDDAMAILFALNSPRLDVLGLTTVFGNAGTEQATANALRLVELAGRNIPVAVGATRPWVLPPSPPPDFVQGSDGLGNIHAPPPAGRPIEADAASFIVQTVRRHPGEVTLLALGPLTNLALALAIEPRLPDLVQRVVVMGGAAGVPGNVSPVAEANIAGDPHAADIVLTTPWPVTMVGLDVTTRVKLDDEVLLRLAKKNELVGGFIFKISRFYRRFYESIGITGGFYVHDPSAVAFVISPDLFSTERSPMRVVTDGIAIGQTIPAPSGRADEWKAWRGRPEVEICRGVDAEGLLRLFESTLSP